jgi:hypothetical protein
MMTYTITEAVLKTEFVRLNDTWLHRYDLDRWNRVVYQHKERGTLLICVQRPKPQPELGDLNNFIVSISALEAYTAIEIHNKVRRRDDIRAGNGDNHNGETRQVHLFLVNDTYRWMSKDYPRQDQIEAEGRTITAEILLGRVKRLGSKLFQGRNPDLFFMDEEFEPIKVVGEDPDNPLRPRSPLRRAVSRNNGDYLPRKALLECQISDGNRICYVSIPDVSTDQLLDLLRTQFHGTEITE